MPDQSKKLILLALALSGLVHGALFYYETDEATDDKGLAENYISVSLQKDFVKDKNIRKENSREKKVEKILVVHKDNNKQYVPKVKQITKPLDINQLEKDEVVNQIIIHQLGEAEVMEVEVRRLSGEQKNILLNLLYRKINNHKKYPYMAVRQRREGLVKVNFMLHPDGRISHVSVVKSSRYRLLDSAALAAVENVSPFYIAQNYLSQTELFDVDIDFRLN